MNQEMMDEIIREWMERWYSAIDDLSIEYLDTHEGKGFSDKIRDLIRITNEKIMEEYKMISKNG